MHDLSILAIIRDVYATWGYTSDLEKLLFGVLPWQVKCDPSTASTIIFLLFMNADESQGIRYSTLMCYTLLNVIKIHIFFK